MASVAFFIHLNSPALAFARSVLVEDMSQVEVATFGPTLALEDSDYGLVQQYCQRGYLLYLNVSAPCSIRVPEDTLAVYRKFHCGRVSLFEQVPASRWVDSRLVHAD